jgi:endogenous inhibitor of DNA gyrase (YacG/DUF329 family)
VSPDIFPDSVEAKCSECGHIWKYERHEALMCPFCNARFESVEFNASKSYAFFGGRRWKAIIKEERRGRSQLPERITGGLFGDWKERG